MSLHPRIQALINAAGRERPQKQQCTYCGKVPNKTTRVVEVNGTEIAHFKCLHARIKSANKEYEHD